MNSKENFFDLKQWIIDSKHVRVITFSNLFYIQKQLYKLKKDQQKKQT